MCCCTSIPPYRQSPCKTSYFWAYTKVSAARIGLRYPVRKQVNSSAGLTTISNQHKWKGQNWVIHQPVFIKTKITLEKPWSITHNDHYIPLKTANCVDVVSSHETHVQKWISVPKTSQTSNTHVKNVTALHMLKLISNIYQQGSNMLELCVGFISLLLERQHSYRLLVPYSGSPVRSTLGTTTPQSAASAKE